MPPSCLKCAEKTCVQSGKPCKAVEKILRTVTSGRKNWETLVGGDVIEKIATKRAFKLMYGWDIQTQFLD